MNTQHQPQTPANIDPEELRERRVDDCRNLFIKYEGQQHEQIEREMRELGHVDFHRRIMYSRFERGKHTVGWIARYSFNRALHRHREEISHMRQRAAMYKRMGWDDFTAETRRRGEEKDNWPQINADDADTSKQVGRHEYPNGIGIDLSVPDPRHLRPSAAKTLTQRLSVSAVEEGLSDFPEFQAWLEHVSPGMTWSWKHQVYIYKRLKRVSEGKCKRLMIFMPPRHGKSELVTVRYAAYRLKQDPKLNIIVGCYNQRLANRFSRKMRRVLTDDAELSRGVEEKRSGGETEDNAGTSLSDSGPQTRCEFHHPCQGRTASSSSSTPPLLVSSSRLTNSEAEWETSAGGGVRAVGVGGGVTGFGAGLIVIDDPVKSRAEAESQTYRDKIWDWFNDDLYTRLEPNGAIILIQTRWHEDDLAGRLLREAQEEGGEQWEVVNLPALAVGYDHSEMSLKGTKIIAQGKDEVRHPRCHSQHDPDPVGVEQTACDVAPLQGAESRETYPGVTRPSSAHPRLLSLSLSVTGDPLDRQLGEALCPERYDVEALERLRRKLGSYSFAALYQQKPVPAEGGLFKRQWFKNIIPTAPDGLRWTRGYDLAMTNTTNSDYTASYRTAYDREGNLYIDGGYRAKIEYPEQRKYILGRIKAEPDTQQHCVELSANGNAVIQDLHRDSRALGRALRGVKVEGSKISRALPWIALAEAGKVYLVRGGWNTEFIDEACSFPSGTHDDQIDAVSIAVRKSRPRLGGRAWGISD